MIRNQYRAERKRSRGLAAVEFAIALPLLLLLLMAFAELGRGYYHYTTLSKLVRDGARYAAEYGVSDSDVVDTVANLVVYGSPAAGSPLLEGMSPVDVAVEQVGTHHVRVSAAYAYQPLFAALPLFWGNGELDTRKTLTSSVTMRTL